MKHFVIFLFASIVAIFPNTSSAQTFTETTGEAGAIESNYASVRGWRVLSGAVNGRFVYCVAEHPDRSTPLRLGNSINGQWQLSIFQELAAVRKDWSGSIEVDDDTRYTNASGSASGKWTVAWLGLDELENIKRGRNMIFGVRKYDFEFSLAGTTAAVLKVEECLKNRGNAPRKRVAQPIPQPRDANGRVIENEAYRTGAGCPKVGTVISPYSSRQASVEFIDQTTHQNGAMVVYWLDDKGRPVDSGVFDNGRVNLSTFVGHSFIVKDRDGTCYGGVYTVRSGSNQFIVR